jgi:hypothetical protein
MNCCGNKRQALQQDMQASAQQNNTEPVVARPEIRFQYKGQHQLSVIGAATGNRYVFAGFGAQLLVDPADAAGLMAEPLLETLRIYTSRQ